MTEPLNTRIRDPKYGKEGIILAYTSKGVPVVEWDGGGVSTFDGEYEVVERPETIEEWHASYVRAITKRGIK